MKKQVLYALLCLCMPFLAAAQKKKTSDSIALNKHRNVASIQTGVGSYYHNKFEGRLTATGDTFRQAKLTAASNTYPLGCWVKVTNLRNKKSVIVKINDRMHHQNPRLIDLSRTAAKRLGYTGHGLARVKVTYLGKKRPHEAEEEDEGIALEKPK
jgi:rare lipoprotein A